MSFDVLFFEVRGRRCALPVASVREVLAAPPVTPVPSAPPVLRGLVPVHGQVLPLLDVGPQLAPGGATGEGGPPGRWDGDRIIVFETWMNRAAVRAALVANRITRLGTVNEGHSRPPPPGPTFVSATVLDVDGPALLLDGGRALESLRGSLLALEAA